VRWIGETKMSKLPKVYIEMSQDGETYIMSVDISEGVSIEVNLDQSDVDYLRKLLELIEKTWKRRGVEE